jgi:hypothetical protein
MYRVIAASVVCFVISIPGVQAQERPQRGTIKKLDAAKGTITITVNGKDRDFLVTEKTNIWDTTFKKIEDGLKDKRFRAGAEVMFKVSDEAGVLVGLKLGGPPERSGAGSRPNPRDNNLQAAIKKIDAAKMIVTLTVNGKDRDFTVTESTRFMGTGGPLQEGLKDKALKTGAPVMFAARKDGDKYLLLGLRVGGPMRPLPPEKVDTSKLNALPELGTEKYKGYEGGLYPEGKNERPKAHEEAGLALARKVQPLDADGKPSANGKIVLLSVGMSNTTQEFSAFKRIADGDEVKNRKLTIVDGAQGGMTAAAIQSLDSDRGQRFWTTVDQRLQAAGASRAQVQVAWIKEADAGPSQGFPKYAQTLQAELGEIVRLMKGRFPNLKIVYLSSRTCAAFAKTRLNPEPYAYESGFSVKWLIEQQIKGEEPLSFTSGKAPWLSWGPYIWTNGHTKLADGLSYEESDFAGDGTHPNQSGQRKVAEALLRFFKSDSTARPWFLAKKE